MRYDLKSSVFQQDVVMDHLNQTYFMRPVFSNSVACICLLIYLFPNTLVRKKIL